MHIVFENEVYVIRDIFIVDQLPSIDYLINEDRNFTILVYSTNS